MQYLSVLQARIEEDFGLKDLESQHAEEEAAATVEVGPATLEAEAQVPAATVGIEDPELPHPATTVEEEGAATVEVWPGSLEEEAPAATLGRLLLWRRRCLTFSSGGRRRGRGGQVAGHAR